jgi:protein phosphatase
MRFLPASAQHIGDRHSQQDSFGFGDPDHREFVEHGGFLAAVCDGMGGMEFGDAASHTAMRAFLDAYQAKTAAESIPGALERSVRAANDEVVALAHEYGLSEGMGTTLVAAAFYNSALYYVSVGDSGLFHLRGGVLRMINRTHTFANQLDAAVARGAISRADAENHPERESLTSFIGAESLEEIDRNLEPFPLVEGDVVLLASDGLFKTLSQEEMIECVASTSGNPLSCPEALVERTIAKKHEHQDNVTVLSIAATPEPVSRLQAAPVVEPGPVFKPPVFEPGVADALPPAPSRSRARLLLAVAILVLAAAGAWWYFFHGRASTLTASPRPSDPGSQVSAPPRATPAEIKVDPDAPVVAAPQVEPPQVEAPPPQVKDPR